MCTLLQNKKWRWCREPSPPPPPPPPDNFWRTKLTPNNLYIVGKGIYRRVRFIAEAVASVLETEKYFWLHLPFSPCKQKHSTGQKIILHLHRSNCFPWILRTSISLHNFRIWPILLTKSCLALRSNWRHLHYFPSHFRTWHFRQTDFLFLCKYVWQNEVSILFVLKPAACLL